MTEEELQEIEAENEGSFRSNSDIPRLVTEVRRLREAIKVVYEGIGDANTDIYVQGDETARDVLGSALQGD